MLLDKDIREPLFDFLEDTFGKVRILEEKTIGKSRADVVMITESALYGIEIKSDADTYARLEKQVKDYDRNYDYNIAVVGTSHAVHVFEHIPEYWGVITVEEVDGRADFYFYRKPELNPKMDWQRKLGILWKTELAQIQNKYDMPKYKEKSREFVVGKIIERMPEKIKEEDLKVLVSEVLFERDYTTIAAEMATYYKRTPKKAASKPKKRKRTAKFVASRFL